MLLTLLLLHLSDHLGVPQNADPDVRTDMETFLNVSVPEVRAKLHMNAIWTARQHGICSPKDIPRPKPACASLAETACLSMQCKIGTDLHAITGTAVSLKGSDTG